MGYDYARLKIMIHKLDLPVRVLLLSYYLFNCMIIISFIPIVTGGKKLIVSSEVFFC